MRENMGLHRGKRLDNGEWVEGSFLRDGESHRFADREDLPFSDCYIVPKTECDNVRTYLTQGILLNVIAYHVIPASVGRFTGLEDKRAKRIFEGDVVSTGKEKYVVRFRNGAFELLRRVSAVAMYFLVGTDVEYEVIGNIHDNPELLEVNEDE